MNPFTGKLAIVTVLCAALLSSCTKDEKMPAEPTLTTASPAASSADHRHLPTGFSTLVVTPGEAGGVAEETVTASATVKSIDRATRKVTLATADGREVPFTAGREVRNLDQLHVGDKVHATVNEKLVIFVHHGNEEPSLTHAAGLAAAPKGAKPGVLVAESYEVVAKVQSIDTTHRTATLMFADNQPRTISVRPDVDLSQYHVGDTLVIRVTSTLSVLAAKP